jgi:hypothetical protein
MPVQPVDSQNVFEQNGNVVLGELAARRNLYKPIGLVDLWPHLYFSIS